MVYFGQAQNGLVKIGWTETVFARIQSIASQVGQRVQLLAAVPGTRADEAALHALFVSTRVRNDEKFRNEWYLPTAQLLTHIASLPPAPVERLRVRRPGADALEHELKARGLTLNRAGKMLGVSAGLVSRWLSGARVPDIDSAVLIEDAFGIAMRSWARDSLGPLPTPSMDPPELHTACCAPSSPPPNPHVSTLQLSASPPHRGETLRAEPMR